jgi:hypothetical protein
MGSPPDLPARAKRDSARPRLASCCEQHVIDLADSYKRLARRPWNQEQLAASYRQADHRGAEGLNDQDETVSRPIASLAAAIPPTTTLSIAIHVLHSLPRPARDSPARQLLGTAGRNAAGGLHHCHRALEVDGSRHDYTPEDWLPVVCERAATLLQAAQLQREPPTIVEQAGQAVSWLSLAFVDLDRDSPEAAATLAETLSRLLTVWVFTDQTGDHPGA